MSPTKRRLIITLATLVLVAMVPAAVMAAGGQFTDDDDSIFESHIEWMATAGVTAGCNPPANDHFCPNDNVNRGQMAAFMRRFAQYIGAEDGTPAEADHAATADALDNKGADSYRTIVAGTTCQGSGCTDVAALSNVKILELVINAPRSGYLQINGVADLNVSGPTNEYVGMWMTLNGDASNWGGCEGSFLGIPLGTNLVNGSSKLAWLDGNIFHASLPSTSVVAVSAGTQTIRLCGFGSAAADTYTANLSALWSIEGSASGATAVTVEELDAAFVERLEDAVNN